MEKQIRPLADRLGIKAGQLFSSLRTAITGRKVSPPLFETMEVLGQQICIQRLDEAIIRLKKLA
jgi:glutamyl-tRNA synthetase